MMLAPWERRFFAPSPPFLRASRTRSKIVGNGRKKKMNLPLSCAAFAGWRTTRSKGDSSLHNLSSPYGRFGWRQPG